MWKNYLKIAWRNIKRSKGYALINIGGLGIGMAASILLLIWVQFEMSVDRFHKDIDDIYAVWRSGDFNGEIASWDYTPAPYVPALKEEYPEIENATHITEWDQILLSVGENGFYEESTFTMPDFFEIFSFEELYGDPVAALEEPNTIVLTETVANKLFGRADVVGEFVTAENQMELEVKAVIKDLPENSSFSFTAFIPYKKLQQMGWVNEDFWMNNMFRTFVKLSEGTDIEAFNAKHVGFTASKSDQPEITDFLYPMKDLYLKSEFKNGEAVGGRIDLLRVFLVVSILVLVIAGINFVNLSTAQSDKRSKEVGVRKISGANRGMLIGQFLAESIVIAVAAYAVAVVLVSVSFESFQNLVQQDLPNPFTQPSFWGISALYVLLIGVLAGSYPAFLMSSYKPALAIKSKMNVNRSFGVKPREVLVVFQFAVVVILVSSVWIVRDQIQFVQDRDLGVNHDNLVYHPLSDKVMENPSTAREQILAIPEVSHVSFSFSPITEIWSNTNAMNWQGKDPNFRPDVSRYSGDVRIAETMGMTILAGRDIDVIKYPSDSTAALINESLAEIIGFDDPIGEIIQDDDTKYKIVGVVKDFIMNSPFHSAFPTLIGGPQWGGNFAHIRYHDNVDLQKALASTEEVFLKLEPDAPFEAAFVDEQHARKFRSEERVSLLTTLFTSLAILISCMGLFGLATFIAERRKKEISVRKVLGASVTGLVGLISKEFTRLVFISVIIGIPVTWYFMSDWLMTFDYHTSINWSLFLWTGILTLLIALLTVSSQAIKAALINPAKTLKSE